MRDYNCLKMDKRTDKQTDGRRDIGLSNKLDWSRPEELKHEQIKLKSFWHEQTRRHNKISVAHARCIYDVLSYEYY